MTRRTAIVFAGLALFAATHARAEVKVDVEVETLAGGRITGAIAAISAEEITVRTAEGERKLPTAEVSRVAFPDAPAKDPKPAAWIELVDGSRLIATELSRTKNKLTFKSPLDAAGAIATTLEGRDVRSVRFQAADDTVLDRFAEIADKKITGDQIVIRRGAKTVDSLAGIVRDITAEAVQFEIDGELRPVPMKRVFAVVFYQPVGRDLKRSACVVTDAAGMKLPAAALKLVDGKITITTPAGLEFERPLDALARIDFAAAKTMFLGDLKPESVEYTPLVGEKASDELRELFQPRVDRALFGGALQLPREEKGQLAPAWIYARGIAIHSRTKLVYRLPREFRSFTAIAGIDSRVRPAGNVRLTIEGDSKQLYSAAVTGKGAATALSLDLTGVKRLTIFVDFGEDLDVADHLNLCDAKLVE
jgi:hypothetical protein